MIRLLLSLCVATPAFAHENATVHTHANDSLFWVLATGVVVLLALSYRKSRS